MDISGVKPVSLAGLNKSAGNVSGPVGDVSKVTQTFGAMLEDALQSVANQEQEVHKLNEQFITGQISDVHNLMIASEKAQIGLQLTVQVRNKVVEAYQEIMRMQL